jgi:hypothetical protein
MAATVPRSGVVQIGGVPSFWVEDLGGLENATWDLFVCSIGYEARSRFFLERFAGQAAAVLVSGYNTRRVQSYAENLDVAYQVTRSVEIENDSDFVDKLSVRLDNALPSRQTPHRILVDISSCSRTRLAALVRECLERKCVCDFVYTPGVFHAPPDDPSALAFTGPVLPSFVGAPASSAVAALRAIVGLGYESLEALGALQLLEPSEMWAMLPVDEDGRYEEVVREENASLLEMLDDEHILRYRVLDGLGTFGTLEQLVYGAADGARSVIVPLGPKVFALCALLVSARFGRAVPVWRFSSDQYGVPIDVQASGVIAGLTVHAEVP